MQYEYNNLFKPRYLKELCERCSLRPSKKYGQNYLLSSQYIEKMIEVAKVNDTDKILEIGPGFGILTFALAQRAGRVYTCEIEKKLQPYWETNVPDNVDIMWGNAINKVEDISNTLQDYKVVANLPYQITSHILRSLLDLLHKPTSITIMVQKEVAERIVAKPGDMSILSVAIQYYGDVRMVTNVSKGNFWPRPQVDSAIIHIDIKNKKKEKNEKDFDIMFFRVLRAGFSHKRKQLWRNLSTQLFLEKQIVMVLLHDICGDEKIRAEDLSVDQWISIVKKLSKVL